MWETLWPNVRRGTARLRAHRPHRDGNHLDRTRASQIAMTNHATPVARMPRGRAMGKRRKRDTRPGSSTTRQQGIENRESTTHDYEADSEFDVRARAIRCGHGEPLSFHIRKFLPIQDIGTAVR